jgi:hypothetical protein
MGGMTRSTREAGSHPGITPFLANQKLLKPAAQLFSGCFLSRRQHRFESGWGRQILQ